MTIEVRPAAEFEAVRTMLGPKNGTSPVCFCLSHRIPAKLNRELVEPERSAYVRDLCASDPAPGVLAFDGDTVVGWAAVAPRSETQWARSRVIPHVDDLTVWSAWCFRVRPGHRKKGILPRLLDGAVRFARDNGAPALEGYPVDNRGERVEQTMAFVGFRAMFEKAGFEKAADTASTYAGFPRVVMRLGFDAAT